MNAESWSASPPTETWSTAPPVESWSTEKPPSPSNLEAAGGAALNMAKHPVDTATSFLETAGAGAQHALGQMLHLAGQVENVVPFYGSLLKGEGLDKAISNTEKWSAMTSENINNLLSKVPGYNPQTPEGKAAYDVFSNMVEKGWNFVPDVLSEATMEGTKGLNPTARAAAATFVNQAAQLLEAGGVFGAGRPEFEKHQLSPAKEGLMGNRRVITPLTKEVFDSVIKPELPENSPLTDFNKYKEEYNHAEYVGLEQKGTAVGHEEPVVYGVGSKESLRPKEDANALKVESFKSPEATQHGTTYSEIPTVSKRANEGAWAEREKSLAYAKGETAEETATPVIKSGKSKLVPEETKIIRLVQDAGGVNLKDDPLATDFKEGVMENLGLKSMNILRSAEKGGKTLDRIRKSMKEHLDEQGLQSIPMETPSDLINFLGEHGNKTFNELTGRFTEGTPEYDLAEAQNYIRQLEKENANLRRPPEETAESWWEKNKEYEPGMAGIMPRQQELLGSGKGAAPGQRGLFDVPTSADAEKSANTKAALEQKGGRTKTDFPKPKSFEESVASLMPGYEAGRDWWKGATDPIRTLLAPTTKSPAHLKAAEWMGKHLGRLWRGQEVSAEALEGPSDHFIKDLRVTNPDIPLKENPGIKFMSDIMNGRAQPTPRLQGIADRIKAMFDDRVERVRALGTGALEQTRENYFPGMWKEKVNPAGFLSKSPLEGKASFRKPKVFDDVMEGIDAGYTPVSNNPIDLVKLKLAEMDKYINAHEAINEAKANGDIKYYRLGEKPPEGWDKINDKYGQVFAPGKINTEEYVDKNVYDGLSRVAGDLGIKHERLYNAGRGALGRAWKGTGEITTQFATELSVLAHEIGHQLDYKYGLWDKIVRNAGEYAGKPNSKGIVTEAAKSAARGRVQSELRALADLNYEGTPAENVSPYKKAQYRKGPEKMADMLMAYIHASDKFKDVAPTVFGEFDRFIKNDPKLAPLAEIKQGLAFDKLTNEKNLSGPILTGNYYAKTPTAEIMNNYLSGSLYNNKYFGPAFKGWMGTANALNQSQLGVGSAFHAGFTSAEVQISKGAEIFKDIYGVMKGDRTVGDLAKTVAEFPAQMIRQPLAGNKILEEWRNPGSQGERIGRIAKAAELAGMRFDMDPTLRTNQLEAFKRDYYGGNYLKAAARSPVAGVEAMAVPIMKWLVPRQKAGLFGELAGRIMDMNPGKELEELTPQFRQAGNRVDSRLGQVIYDRYFINNTAKNVVQALVRAPGWTGGTIAEIAGGVKDAKGFINEWLKTGKMPENLPDRTAYVLSLAATTAILNGAFTYLFTGEKPKGNDFWAFRDGTKDDQGRDNRWVLPTYAKDVFAYRNDPAHTLVAKAHPLVGLAGNLAQNKDYYNTQIYNPDDSFAAKMLEGGEYSLKQFVPFWMRGAAKAAGADSSTGVLDATKAVGSELAKNPAKTVGPLVGVMPATSAYTQSPAEKLMHKYAQDNMPVGTRTKAEAEKGTLKRGVIGALRSGKELTASQQEAFDNLPGPQRMAIRREARIPPLVLGFKHLHANQAIDVWNKADADEKQLLTVPMRQKMLAAIRARTMDRDEVAKLTGLFKEKASAF